MAFRIGWAILTALDLASVELGFWFLYAIRIRL